MNKEETQYFRDHWQPNWQDKKYSGWALLDKIAPTDSVLDIGCGTNPLKERLGEQVYGIDPAFDQADKLVTWEDYKPHKEFNVYLCLGSLNFGTTAEVEKQKNPWRRRTRRRRRKEIASQACRFAWGDLGLLEMHW